MLGASCCVAYSGGGEGGVCGATCFGEGAGRGAACSRATEPDAAHNDAVVGLLSAYSNGNGGIIV